MVLVEPAVPTDAVAIAHHRAVERAVTRLAKVVEVHHAHDAGGSSVQLDIQDLHGNGIFVKPFAIDIGQVGVHRLSLARPEVLHLL